MMGDKEGKKDGHHHHPKHRDYNKTDKSKAEKSTSEAILAHSRTRPEYPMLKKVGYEVLKQIGSGSYARVYKVQRIGDSSNRGKLYAVKVIHPSKHSRQYRNRMLPRELMILAGIHHQNIIPVRKIFQDKTLDTILIIMDFAVNGTLHDYVDDHGPLPESEAKRMFRGIAEAIKFMHGLPDPVAHRDLKLDNILLDENKEPKLTDFSYTRYCTDETDPKSGHILSKTYCGTEPFLAPEVLYEKPYDPLPADIWSLGVCLFMMLNEKYPFHGKYYRIRKAAMEKDYSFQRSVRDKISNSAKDLVGHMMEPDIKKRFTIRQVCHHPWLA